MIRCYLKGFIGELLSMAAILFGLLAAIYFYKNGGEFLRNHFWHGVKAFPEVVAFIALFVFVFIAIKLLEILLKGIINGISLGGADRFLGIVFGFLEGIAVVSLILFLLRVQPLFDPGVLLSESFFANLLLPLILSPETTEKLAGV
jgi:membrane protein required for colicin V production